MILMGFLILWTSLLWVFHKRITDIFRHVHHHNNKRIGLLQQRLHRNFIFREKDDIHKFVRWIFVCGTLTALMFRSSLLLAAIFMVYLFFPIVWIYWVEYIRKKQFKKQLLILIPSLSSMLRSGHGLERALAEIRETLPAPISEEIHFMLKEMQLGTPLEETLNNLVLRFPSENLLMLSHAIIISRKLGSSLSEAMDHIAQNILEKEKLSQQILALTSQGKMQAYLAVCMPFFLGVALQFISPGYFQPLFETFFGKCCLIYCFVSILVGLFGIRQITHREYL